MSGKLFQIDLLLRIKLPFTKRFVNFNNGTTELFFSTGVWLNRRCLPFIKWNIFFPSIESYGHVLYLCTIKIFYWILDQKEIAISHWKNGTQWKLTNRTENLAMVNYFKRYFHLNCSTCHISPHYKWTLIWKISKKFFIKIPISNTTNASIRIFEFNSHSNSNRVTHSKGRMVHKSQSFIRQIPKVQQLSVKLVCQHNMMRSGGAFYSMFA